jgi:L-threonylcarbamoyladenylate synthase
MEMIRECIPDLSTGQESRLEKEAHPRAPGMKYRHYAPQAPLILVDSDQAIRDLCVQAAGEGKKVGVLTSREHASFYEASCVRILGGEADEEEMAHNLFASLRAFDREGVDVIYSETFDEQGIGMALMNRLRKAAQKG